MAFAIIDFFDGSLSDPRYIKWVARNITMQDNVYTVNYMPMEPCTDGDLDRFFSSDEVSWARMQSLQKQKGLYCLEWPRLGPKLIGSWKTHSDYTAVDVAPIPCIVSYTSFDGQQIKPRDDCVWDQ